MTRPVRKGCPRRGHPAALPRRAGPGAVLALLAGTAGAAAEPAVALSAAPAGSGLGVALELRPAGDALRAGEPALLRLDFTAPGGGAARGLRPAAWAERATARPQECRARVRGLLERRFGRAADVDFNAWHLAYAGSNGAVQVIDPVGGSARTRLLAAIDLGAVPGGWAEDPARDAIFVSLPERGEVVEIDTLRWAERRRIAVPGRPARMALDADGALLWVGQDGEPGATEAVALVDRNAGQVVAGPAIGPGPHVLAATEGGRAVAASATGAAALDGGEARPLPALGGGFDDASYSRLAAAALLLDARGGRVLSIGTDHRVNGTWEVSRDAAGLFPDPSGRLLFVPEPGERRVAVIDLARGAVAHRVALDAAPLRVGFSGTQAYVQSEAGASVFLIALGSLAEGAAPAVTVIAAGEGGLRPGEALGPTVAPAPGGEGVLIAAPSEGVVHVYMEGMAAPSGMLRAPRGRPLAIAAVDRGLREIAPGRYETSAIFPAPGRYVLPVLVQGGALVHCFDVEIPGEGAPPLSRRLGLELAAPDNRVLLAGAAASVRVRLRGPADDGAWRAGADLTARLVQFSGHWQVRLPLRPLGDGLYEASNVAPPRPGPLNLYVESPSLGLEAETLPHIMLRAVSP